MSFDVADEFPVKNTKITSRVGASWTQSLHFLNFTQALRNQLLSNVHLRTPILQCLGQSIQEWSK